MTPGALQFKLKDVVLNVFKVMRYTTHHPLRLGLTSQSNAIKVNTQRVYLALVAAIVIVAVDDSVAVVAVVDGVLDVVVVTVVDGVVDVVVGIDGDRAAPRAVKEHTCRCDAAGARHCAER